MKKSFKSELKRQIRMAITAAIGFIIAFTWRESIVSLIQSFTEQSIGITQPIFLQNISAFSITLIGVLLIFITSKLLQD